MERIELLKVTADPEKLLKNGDIKVTAMNGARLTEPEEIEFKRLVAEASDILAKALMREVMIKCAEEAGRS
ncbi:hypothetical protein QBE53_05975 [Vallitaleaceae bacterium 9-2]